MTFLEDTLRKTLENADKSVQVANDAIGKKSVDFERAVDDVLLFAARNELTVHQLVEGMGEFIDEAGLKPRVGRDGLGRAANSRQFTSEGAAASPLARFVADTENSTTSRILAPAVAWALVTLDSHATRLLPGMESADSLEPVAVLWCGEAKGS